PERGTVLDLSYSDFGVYRRLSGDGHTPADRSCAWAAVMLRRLRVGGGKNDEKSYRKENRESGESNHSGLLEVRREAGANRPLTGVECVMSIIGGALNLQ